MELFIFIFCHSVYTACLLDQIGIENLVQNRQNKIQLLFNSNTTNYQPHQAPFSLKIGPIMSYCYILPGVCASQYLQMRACAATQYLQMRAGAALPIV